MLRYLALGLRDYGAHPMVVSRRVDWEFYVILKGRAAPTFESDKKPGLGTRTMWVFAPENMHGWSGVRGRPCKIAAFQFALLPNALMERTRRAGALAVPLTAAQTRAIETMALELQPHFDQPNSLSELQIQIAQLRLSLIALQQSPPDQIHPYHKMAQEKVAAALRYYSDRLPDNPPVKMIAAAVHVSPSYLRRLCWEVRQQSPKALLRRIQMERVVKRLSESSDGLEQIAVDCGFLSASDLCRAFKASFSIPPALWRKTMLPKFSAPQATRGEAAKFRPDTPVHRKLSKYVRFTSEVAPKRRIS